MWTWQQGKKCLSNLCLVVVTFKRLVDEGKNFNATIKLFVFVNSPFLRWKEIKKMSTFMSTQNLKFPVHSKTIPTPSLFNRHYFFLFVPVFKKRYHATWGISSLHLFPWLSSPVSRSQELLHIKMSRPWKSELYWSASTTAHTNLVLSHTWDVSKNISLSSTVILKVLGCGAPKKTMCSYWKVSSGLGSPRL